MIQITESSVPDDDAAQRMAQLLKMAQGNNSSHVAVLDMLVEQLSNVQHQLAIHTIVINWIKFELFKDSGLTILLCLPISEGRPNTTKIRSSLCEGNIERMIRGISRCGINFSSTWHTATLSSMAWPHSYYCFSWIWKFTVGGIKLLLLICYYGWKGHLNNE